MLLQSHTGVIRIFPAVPDSWKDARFEKLRTVGAFLVSAVMEGGKVSAVEIHSEKGGRVSIQDPFGGQGIKTGKEYRYDGNMLVLEMDPGETVLLKAVE
jgi:alpha-L-fucosidase 2